MKKLAGLLVLMSAITGCTGENLVLKSDQASTDNSDPKVTVTGGAHFTISPAEAQIVKKGSTLEYVVTGDTGYRRSRTIGGTCPEGTWDDITYTTGEITQSCTIVFKVNPTGPDEGRIFFDQVTSSTIRINWTPATDVLDDPSELEYRLVQSTTGPIEKVADADAITTAPGLIVDWSSGTSPATLSGLSAGYAAYFAVEVRNKRGGKTLYDSIPRVTGPMIYATYRGVNANQMGITGNAPAVADSYCRDFDIADRSVNRSATNLSALFVDDTHRKACTTPLCSGGAAENLNWPVPANTLFYNSRGGIVGTTNSAGIFPVDLSNSVTEYRETLVTGLSMDWTNLTDNCNGWTKTDYEGVAVGDSSAPDLLHLFLGASTSCEVMTADIVSPRILCVEH